MIKVGGESYLTKHHPAPTTSVLSPVDERDIWRGYDAGKAWSAIERLAGSWSGIDTDRLAKDVRRWRTEGSRS
jgi:hypothetical protein